MLIEISNEFFETVDHEEQLRKILQDFAYKRRYDYYIDYLLIKDTEIFKNLYDISKDLIIEYFNKQSTENKSLDYLISNLNSGDRIFTIEDSIKFFNQPLYIVLENSNNDCHFLNAVIANFKKAAKKIRRFQSENWIKYEMGGGADNIINYLEGEKKNHNGDSRFLRCFVLVDSDLQFTQVPNIKRQKLEKYLNDNGISYHVLEKREMENYLPNDILEANGSNNFITTYLRLTDEQKDFIDLEKGFQKNKKSLKSDEPEVYRLYENLTDKEVENLRHGLENNYQNFKAEFPLHFGVATQEGLLERVKSQKVFPEEFHTILNKINDLI